MEHDKMTGQNYLILYVIKAKIYNLNDFLIKPFI